MCFVKLVSSIVLFTFLFNMSYTEEYRKMSPNCNYLTFTVTCFEQNLSEDDFSDLEPEDAEILEYQKQLVCATFASDVSLIKELLNSGVSVDTTEYNKHLFSKSKYFLTPLQVAIALGDKETLKCLIYHGANVNCKDRYHVTPIHMAAEQGHFECLQILLEAGAKCYPLSYYHRTYFNPAPFYNGTTPLHIAVTKKHVLCIKELMKYTSDYNAVDELGRTVLYIASEMGSEECVSTLLKNTVGRVILSVPGFESGDTPLHFAIRHVNLQSIKELLLQGCDVHCDNIKGYSPMDICFKYLYSDPEVFFKILKLIVFYGCNTDVNQPILGRLAPLEQVMKCGKHVYSKYMSPLEHVVYSDTARSVEFAKFLIAFGANFSNTPTRNLNFLELEFKKFQSDPTILKAILDSMCFPPRMDCLFLTLRNRKQLISTVGRRSVKRVRTTRNQRLKGRMLIWYENEYPSLPSLQHLCRFTVRHAMGPKRLNKVKDFPIPNKCISYILLGIEV